MQYKKYEDDPNWEAKTELVYARIEPSLKKKLKLLAEIKHEGNVSEALRCLIDEADWHG